MLVSRAACMPVMWERDVRFVSLSGVTLSFGAVANPRHRFGLASSVHGSSGALSLSNSRNPASSSRRLLRCAVAGSCETTKAASMSLKQIVEQALAQFADPSRRDQYFDLYSDNVVLHGYGIEPGLDNVRRYYAAIWAAFPDARVSPEELIETGDRVVVRFEMRGTHRGPFLGIQPSGKFIVLPGMTILRFENQRCVERWSVTDGLALLVQLGAVQVGDR